MEEKFNLGINKGVLESFVNREDDIKKIIVYLAEKYQSVCRLKYISTFDVEFVKNVYTDIIDILNKWVNHEEIKEIAKITSVFKPKISSKLQIGDGLLHYNDEHYPFVVVAIDKINKICTISPLGSNYVEAKTNTQEVSFDIIDKEFNYFTIPIERDL